MATVSRPPELHTGDRMTREEFHRIYEATPEHFRAELIGGVVYVASPLKRRHGTAHMPLSTLLYTYEGHTPGVESGNNSTILLGDAGQPQPDLYLRILPEFGGQSRTTAQDYVEGAPEFIVEIADSSLTIDLHAKREDYTRYGVLEYLVVCLREKEIRWFDLKAGQELRLDQDGVHRICTFPGLWIQDEALFANDYQRLMATLQQGLSSPEHASFAAMLVATQV